MPIYLNAVIMLAATIAAFVGLAKLTQILRTKSQWRRQAATTRLAIEQATMVDGKRRLLLVRCDQQQMLLLTGGPADLVISVWPAA